MSSAAPRLKSVLWVQATLRRWQGEGLFAAVLNSGADDAGAIFVVINRLDGTCDLFAPPPGPAIDAQGDRHFRRETALPVSWADISTRMKLRRKNDPDLWLIEVEDRHGAGGLKLVPE